MTPEQIELVQRAWTKVTALNHSYVQEVYEELFRHSPELTQMFSAHPILPVNKVSETLNTLITSLDQLAALGFIIKDLGRRHRQHHVQPHHFELLKQAMTAVLARRLGANFRPDLAEAWSQMYDEVSALMLSGLGHHPDPRPETPA